MAKQIVFKVVRRNFNLDGSRSNYRSSWIDRPEFQLGYDIGKVTRAPRGTMGVFVFEKYRDAAAYRDNVGGTILKVEAYGKMIPAPMLISNSSLRFFKHFRRAGLIAALRELATKKNFSILDGVRGAYTAESVKPLEVVK